MTRLREGRKREQRRERLGGVMKRRGGKLLRAANVVGVEMREDDVADFFRRDAVRP